MSVQQAVHSHFTTRTLTDSIMADQETQAQSTPLYQYTSASGLKGIADNQSLWLTHILYQNDTRELYDGLDLIKEVIENEYSNLSTHFISDPAHVSIYTASFTEEQDLLSQWRGYCPRGGYSFELDPRLFENLEKYPNHLVLRKCIYDRNKKIEFIKNSIIGYQPQAYREYLDRLDKGGMHMPRTKEHHRINRNIYNLVGVMKDSAFAEEKEWRLMTYYAEQTSSMSFSPMQRDYKIRVSNEKLVPYIEAKFSPVDDQGKSERIPSIFKKIRVSPSADPVLAKASCELLINDPSCIVRNSSIPYKNW